MKKSQKITILILVMVIIGIIVFSKKNQPVVSIVQPPVAVQNKTIIGCYNAILGKDVYTLNITSQNEDNVSGKLAFKNFDKDSSSGTFNGTYRDGILLGIYSFDSEGMHSDAQVAFKKTADGFVRGFGEINQSGDHFTNPNNLSYDSTYTFKETTCSI